MKNGNVIIRLGIGLLFVWGGLEKFFEGFLGGVGLHNMAEFLKTIGLSFLGDASTFMLGLMLALVELAAGIFVLLNRNLFLSYAALTFIMVMALLLAHAGSDNWMMIMLHVSLILTLSGLAIDSYKDNKWI